MRVHARTMPWMWRLFHPAFKNRLNRIRMTRMGYFMDLLF